MPRLSDYISFNSDFKDSVNLYLDLNKSEKIKSYIPTNSSVDVLGQYLEAVDNNKQQSTLLIGPYGKGKSHLLLLLLAVLSMNRKLKENKDLIGDLLKRIKNVNSEVAKTMKILWKKERYLPVIIMSTQGDLNQAFLLGLNEALKRENLNALTPETYYTYALETIERWEREFPETYKAYKQSAKAKGMRADKMISNLKNCDAGALNIFRSIYPELTSGSEFNPLVNTEVLTLFANVAENIQEYGYAGIYIIFDEFSKYIEGQNKKTTGNNMKLLQDICELANSSSNARRVFFTMVAHKSIKEYGKQLSAEVINSFTGIEGRLREIFFVTSSKNNYELIQNAIFKTEDYLDNPNIGRMLTDDRANEFYHLSAFRTIFKQSEFNEMVVKGCYPLSPTSAFLLLNVSEKVAQNERTLFTFISKPEQHSVAKYVIELEEHDVADWIINANLIYDYFTDLFRKDLTNEYIHNEWLNAEYAIKHCKNPEQKCVLKVLAIINIVNKPEEMPATRENLRLCSGVDLIDETLDALESLNIIYKKRSNGCYVFKTRATSALKSEIKKRKEIKGSSIDISKILTQISDISYVLPKRYNDAFCMTRYFRYEFMNVDEFLNMDDLKVIGEGGEFCDGKVVALYSLDDNNRQQEIQEKMLEAEYRRLIVVYGNYKLDVLEQIKEYEVLQEIKADSVFFKMDENQILQKEIPTLEEDLGKEIQNYMDSCFGENADNCIFYWKDADLYMGASRISTAVDEICFGVYGNAIRVNNELINKRVISTAPIKKVRKNIIQLLLDKGDTKKYYQGTSADSTIYRALFVGTGIDANKQDENTQAILDIYNAFLDSAVENKIKVRELVAMLCAEPYGMREGIIPIYLAYAISRRNEDVIIYLGNQEVALDADAVINMCSMPDDYLLYISEEDVNKEAYFAKLCQIFNISNESTKSESRIEKLQRAMQKWFRSLPQVTKNLKSTNEYFCNEEEGRIFLGVKKLLQNVETNPYEMLFVQIPELVSGVGLLDVASEIEKLKNSLNEYYDWISVRVAEETIAIFDEKRKNDLYHTLKEWYDRQSEMAKNGLFSAQITRVMSYIAGMGSYDDCEIVRNIVKNVSEIYMDSWNDNSFTEYIEELKSVKKTVEEIGNKKLTNNACELSFIGKNGEPIKRYYEPIGEGTGAILRTMISGALEDFPDLSVNDKVAILLEMIEKETS